VLVLNSRTVLETRGQFARGDLEAPPTDLIGPAVSIAGVAAFGRLSTSPTASLNSMVQVVNNLVHQAGDHAVRAGVDLLYNDDTITFPRAVKGSYAFSSLSSFLSGIYNNSGFTQTFGDTMVSQTNANVGTFVQDEWRVGSRVTLNAGLRYELQVASTPSRRTRTTCRRGPESTGRRQNPAARSSARARGGLRPRASAGCGQRPTVREQHDGPAELRQIGVSLSPGNRARPCFPPFSQASCRHHARQPHLD
jgi:outer membrane receptor protein involved in Fe transport